MGVKILRHRTGLLYKSCKTILWLKQIHVSFKHRQKIRFDSSCQQQNITRILKIVIAEAGGGEVLIHHTFLTTPTERKEKTKIQNISQNLKDNIFLNLLVLIVTNMNFLLTIFICCQEKWLWELIKWSPKRKCFVLLLKSLNLLYL